MCRYAHAGTTRAEEEACSRGSSTSYCSGKGVLKRQEIRTGATEPKREGVATNGTNNACRLGTDQEDYGSENNKNAPQSNRAGGHRCWRDPRGERCEREC